MKICIITSIFPPEIGGPATYSYELAKRLKERHKVRVITWNSSPERIEGVEIYSLNPGIFTRMRHNILYRALRLLNIYKNLFLYLYHSRKDIDIIYLQNVDIFGAIVILFAKILRKPMIVKFVGDVAWEFCSLKGKTNKPLEDFLKSPEGGIYIGLLLRLQKFVLNKVDKVIVPSYFLKSILAKYYHVSLNKIKVIYNSVDLEDYHEIPFRRFQRSTRPTVVTIGRLVRHKRIDKIIEAISVIKMKYPDVEFQIIGEGPEKENLEELTCELGVERNVKFYGSVEHSKVIELIQNADILVLNSIYEGLPHVVIEGMACRVPVVATDVGGTNEILKDGETGLLVTPDNDEELREKIALLLRDRKLRERLVENAYKQVEQKFTWEKNIGILEKELEEVV